MKMCHSHSVLQPKATQGHWQLPQTCMCVDKVVSTNMCDRCQPALQTFALLDKSVHIQYLCLLTFVSWHKSSTIKSLFACVWPHLYVWVQWCPAPDDEIIWQSMEWQFDLLPAHRESLSYSAVLSPDHHQQQGVYPQRGATTLFHSQPQTTQQN